MHEPSPTRDEGSRRLLLVLRGRIIHIFTARVKRWINSGEGGSSHASCIDTHIHNISEKTIKKSQRRRRPSFDPFAFTFFFFKKKSSHLETQKKRKNSLGRGERLEEKRKVLIYRPASSCAIHQAKLEDMPGER